MTSPSPYHLNKNKEDLGRFSADELRRKREGGELDGTEWVWRPGMDQWQRLDAVLNEGARAIPGGPPPLPKRKKRRLAMGLAVGFAVLLVGVITLIGLAAHTLRERFEQFGNDFVRAMSSERGIELAGPVRVSPTTMTADDVREVGREFRLRHYLEGYQANGRRDHACDADSVTFLRMWIAHHFGGEWPESELSPAELSEKVAASGCVDPMVLAIAALHSTEGDRVGRLDEAVNGLAESRHAPYPRFWATVVQTENYRRAPAQLQRLDAIALDTLRELIAEGDFPLGDQEIFAESLVHGWGERFLKRHADEVVALFDEASPEFEWLRLVLDGERHVIRAWEARGGGYAHTVSDEGWSGFRSHLTEARNSFERAWELNPSHPLVPSRMIYVAMGQSRPANMRVWFDRALDVQIDYLPAWDRMRWGLRPRWHGSHEAMLALGISAVDTGRFDTYTPRVLFNVVRDLERDMRLADGEHLFGREDIWPHIERMYEAYIAEPVQEPWRDGWRSAYACIAYLGGKYHVAREQLEAANWQLREDTLASWNLDPHLMPLEVAARTGPHGARVSEAEERWARERWRAARAIYAELAEEELDERTREFVEARLTAIEAAGR